MLNRVVVLLFAMLSLIVSNTLFANSQHDDYKTIILDGEYIPQSLGNEIDSLSLAAVHNGTMEPIPFQIDEYNEGGALYFEGWDVPINGTKGIMDETDKLLFIIKDAGEKYNKQPYDGEVIAEIKVSDTGMDERYVYLIKGSRLRSDTQYVRYSSELARVETDFYDLSYETDNHLIWKDFNVASYQGEGEPFDTMKIRFEAGFITSLATVELNNKHMVAVPKGEHIGPIRTTTQLELTMWMLDLPIFTASLQLHHNPKSLVYDLRVVVPEFRRSLIVDPSAVVSLDGNALLGAHVYTANGPKTGALVDGVMGEQEQQVIDGGLSPGKNWLLTNTGKNLDVIAYFDYLGETNVPLSVVLLDDKEQEDKPERYKGQLPNFGIRVGNMPTSGLFGIAVSLYVDDQFEGKPSQFSRKLRSMPDIEVN